MAGPRLLLMGAGEFTPWAAAAERHALSRAEGDGSVAVLATASGAEADAVYQGWLEKGVEHYASLGIPARPVRVRHRADAMQPELASGLGMASMIFFSGGSSSYLAECVTGTPLWAAIRQALARGAVFGGCSAGAMVAGAAIGGGAGAVEPPPRRRRRRPSFPFGGGLDLCPNTVFGVHWDALGKWWLRPVRNGMEGRVPAGHRLVGIPGNTAIFSDGETWRVFGAGFVEVIRGRSRAAFREGDTFPVNVG